MPKANTDDKKRIALLKSELHYFKGLSIMMLVLILCVFFAFGVLFSSMYLEVRMLNNSISNFFSSVAIQSNSIDVDNSDALLK